MNKLREKTVINIFVSLFIASLLLVCTVNVFAEENIFRQDSTSNVTNVFTYPITPFTTPERWKGFKTHDQMVESCQIPENILQNMTTLQLLKTCLDYPLYGDIFLFDNYGVGFNNLVMRFNGLQEFLDRKDAGNVMAKYYQSVDLNKIESETDCPNFLLTYINLLISQEKIQASLSETEQKSIILKSKELLNEIESNYQLFDTNSIENLINQIVSRESELISKIGDIHLANTYTTIYTPNGTSVTAIRMTTEHPNNIIDEYRNYVQTCYPYATIVRDATQKYNCHSYAWYSQSSTNNIWIDSPEQKKYWSDGSYSLIATYSGGSWPSGITHGAKVDYVNDNHSARVYSSTEMISKWGPGPLVRHPFAYCPYVSTAANFYD